MHGKEKSSSSSEAIASSSSSSLYCPDHSQPVRRSRCSCRRSKKVLSRVQIRPVFPSPAPSQGEALPPSSQMEPDLLMFVHLSPPLSAPLCFDCLLQRIRLKIDRSVEGNFEVKQVSLLKGTQRIAINEDRVCNNFLDLIMKSGIC